MAVNGSNDTITHTKDMIESKRQHTVINYESSFYFLTFVFYCFFIIIRHLKVLWRGVMHKVATEIPYIHNYWKTYNIFFVFLSLLLGIRVALKGEIRTQWREKPASVASDKRGTIVRGAEQFLFERVTVWGKGKSNKFNFLQSRTELSEGFWHPT